METLTPFLDPARHAWLRAKGLARIVAVLTLSGGVVRIVGGAVRDALLGRPVGDIDLATTLPPWQVQLVLEEAGIKVAPTGLAHGTVTAVADGKGYEITTLRSDVATDGRHAKVVFTEDFKADALRRDLTMNALYADLDGTVYDYGDGYADLCAGRVRFIGAPLARVAEDYLRVLRYFRFFAWYGRGPLDQEALEACRAARHALTRLSVERIWKEMRLFLAAPAPLAALQAMEETGVLASLLPEADAFDVLMRLLPMEEKGQFQADPLLRLAALLRGPDQSRALAGRWHFSRRDALALQALEAGALLLRTARLPRVAFYRIGAIADKALALAAARWPDFDADSAWAAWQKGECPVFPLRGRDIVALGVPQGPQVSAILKLVEEAWISQDFWLDRDACLAVARREVEKTRG